ncbi:arsenate reductase ArsC [Methanogenium sp. S4BF]|uniref:arsenate reductase/protein-tyrosine-phosphatase family protein n=1 Tax=Methanogenium sp. S4BF TaxID=1789226 RepID=UPI00241614EB|nr:arsenate reductase ArsC [Methanogenium sp. S4BF]WFN34186.1 arsenate reductase ArsC [Methanogenium sp. S4BF]
MSPDLHRVLFVCTYNSVRSPMAAAILNAAAGNLYRAESAGLFPSAVDPDVVAVMRERGIDLSSHHPRSLGACSDTIYGTIIFLSPSVRESAYHIPSAGEYITLNIPVPGAAGADGRDGYRMLCQTLKGAIAECFPDAGIAGLHNSGHF